LFTPDLGVGGKGVTVVYTNRERRGVELSKGVALNRHPPALAGGRISLHGYEEIGLLIFRNTIQVGECRNSGGWHSGALH
jgi:hypothetical protein